MNGCSFRQDLWQNSGKTLENGFSLRFHIKTNRKSIGSSKKLGIFKIAIRLRDRHAFMWQSLKILNVFNILTLKQIFWKTKKIFEKTGVKFFSRKH